MSTNINRKTGSVTIPEFGVNDALAGIGLFDIRSELTLRGDRGTAVELMQLFSLFEAITLHDTLVVWSYFPDSNPLGVPRELIENGVVRIIGPKTFFKSKSIPMCGDEDWYENCYLPLATKFDLVFDGTPKLPNDSVSESLDMGNAIRSLINNESLLNQALAYRFTLKSALDDQVVSHYKGNRSQLAAPVSSAGHVVTFQQVPSQIQLYSLFAEKLNIDYFPSCWEVPFVLKNRLVPRENIIKALYGALNEQFRESVNQIVEIGTPIRIYIPPIPALVLQTAKSSGCSLLGAALQVREQFSGFRNSFATYKSSFKNSKLTVADSLKLRKKFLVDICDELSHLNNGCSESSILSESFTSTAQESDSGLDVSSAFSLSAFSKQAHRLLSRMVTRRRARILFDVWNKISKIEEYSSLVQTTLGWSPSMSDINAYRSFCKVTDEIIKPNQYCNEFTLLE